MTCKKCGADTKPGAPGVVIKCEYCGHEERLPVAKPRAPQVVINVAGLARDRPTVKIKPLGCLLGIGLIAGGGVLIFALVRGTSSSSSSSSPSSSSSSSSSRHKKARRPRARDKQWTLAEIPKAPQDRWFQLDRSGMVGTLAQLDAIANYPWALKMARGWSSDAKLVRLGVRRVRHDGVGVNAVEKRQGSAEYRFFSPSRFAAAEKLSEVSEQKMHDGFRIWIRGNKASAMITNVSPDKRTYPDPTVKCTYTQILKGAQPIQKRPYYDFMLRYWKHRNKWIWKVNVASSLKRRRRRRRRRSGVRSRASVDAKSCKRTN